MGKMRGYGIMGKMTKSLVIAIIYLIVLIGCASCLSETIRILDTSFSTYFPDEEKLDYARDKFVAKSISEMPEEDNNFRINNASFRDDKIMITYSDAHYQGSTHREYILFFDLNGTFISGFYIENGIRNGVRTVIYNNRKLYYYSGFTDCLYEVNDNSEMKYYYVPSEYEMKFWDYREIVAGCDIKIETNDTGSNKVVFTNASGDKLIIFSDSYDSQWVKDQNLVVAIIVIFNVVINIFVIKRHFNKRKCVSS